MLSIGKHDATVRRGLVEVQWFTRCRVKVPVLSGRVSGAGLTFLSAVAVLRHQPGDTRFLVGSTSVLCLRATPGDTLGVRIE